MNPCLVQSSRSISRIQTVQGPKQISSLVQWGSTSVYLADQETQGDIMIATEQMAGELFFFGR